MRLVPKMFHSSFGIAACGACYVTVSAGRESLRTPKRAHTIELRGLDDIH
jgi:ferredoxin